MVTSSSVGFKIRGRWALACAAAVIIAASGCVAAPDAAAPDAEPQASSPPTSGATDSAPASSAVPAPEPAGSVGPTEQPALPIVEGGLDEEIELSTGFVVALGSITATTVEAETPGDVAGDAIAVVVTVTNASSEPQSIDSAVVTLETADGGLGIPTLAGGAAPLSGEVAPQASAEGRYLFMLDPVEDRDITISVNYAAGEPVAQFTGRTP